MPGCQQKQELPCWLLWPTHLRANVQDVLHDRDGQAQVTRHLRMWGTGLGAVLATSHHPFPKALRGLGSQTEMSRG